MKKIYILTIEYNDDTEQIEYLQEEVVDESVIGGNIVYIDKKLDDSVNFEDSELKKLIDDGVLGES
jgi:hypothetical protein